MAKFVADRTFRDFQKGETIEKGTEFDMTIKRSEELVANIKNNFGVDLVLTRTDKEVVEEAEETEETKEGK